VAKGKDRRTSVTKPTQTQRDDFGFRRALSRASASDLQALYLRVYRKKQILKNRSELITALDKYLLRLPENERTRILRSVASTQSDPTETYRRWVDIISKDPREADDEGSGTR
jgi:hypothetical protein